MRAAATGDNGFERFGGGLKNLLTSQSKLDRTEKLSGMKTDLAEHLDDDNAALGFYFEELKKGTPWQEAFNKHMGNASETAQGWVKTNGQLVTGVGSYQTSVEAATTATKTSTAAMIAGKAAAIAMNMALTMGISLLIQGAITLIDNLLHAEENAIKTANELESTLQSSMSDDASDLKTLSDMSTEFKALSKGVDEYGNNINLAADDYERYKDLVSQILTISPSLKRGYDEEGNAIAGKNNLLEESIRLQKNKMEADREEATSTANLWKMQNGYIAEYNKSADGKDRLNDSNIISDLVARDEGPDAWGNWVSDERNDYLASIFGDGLGGNVDIDLAKDGDKLYEAVKKRRDLFREEDIEALAKYLDDRDGYLDEMERQSKRLNPFLQAVPQNSDKYETLSDASKGFLQQYIDNLQNTPETLGSEEAVGNLKEHLLSMTEKLATDPELQSAVTKLMSLDVTKIGAEDYQKQADELLDIIANALGLDEDGKMQLKVALIPEDVRNYPDLLKKAQDQLGEAYKDQAGSLSLEDLKIAATLDLDNASWDDLLANINKAKVESKSFDNTLTSLDEEFKTIGKSIKTAGEAIADLDSAIESSENNQAMSGSQITDLLAKYPELGAAVMQVTDAESGAVVGYQIEIGALKRLRAEKIKASMESIQADLNRAKSELETAKSNLLNYNSEILGIKSVAEAKAELARLSAYAKDGDYSTIPGIGTELEAWNQYIQKLDQVTGLEGNYQAMQTAMAMLTMPAYSSVLDKNSDSKDKNTAANEKAAAALEKTIKGYEKAKKEADAYTKSLEDQKQAYEDEMSVMNTDISSINSLLDLVKKLIRQNYDDQKKALQEELESLNENHDKYMDNLDEEKEAIDKKIDAQLKLLRAQEDEYDYQKSLAEKEKAVADLKAQLVALSLDDSEEAKKQRLQIEDDLTQKQGDLDDFLHDHSVQMQEDALQEEKEKYDEYYENLKEQADEKYNQDKDILDSKIEDIQNYCNEEYRIRQEAMDLINAGGSKLYEDLLEYNRVYGTGVDAEIQRIWENAYVALKKYSDGNIDVLRILEQLTARTTTLQGEVAALEPLIDAAQASAQRFQDSIDIAQDKANVLKDKINEAKQATDNLNTSMLNYAGNIGTAVTAFQGFEKQAKNTVGAIGNACSGIVDLFKPVYGPQLPGEWKPSITWPPRYASGTPGITIPGPAIVDENGPELRFNKGKFVNMKYGDVVIPSDISERILALASEPMDFVGRVLSLAAPIAPPVNISAPSYQMPNVSINIEGNASKETVLGIKSELDGFYTRCIEGATNNVFNKLNNATRHIR